MSSAHPLVRTVTLRPAAPQRERARIRALLLGLRSRYVVPVLAADQDEDGLVVRYDVPADVTTLAARCADGPALTLPEAVRVAADIAWGLAAGAATGLAHGRLDATQIVLGDGPARVLGLGLATLDAAPPPAGVDVAPEIRAGGPPTESADLWSLGGVLRDLLAGLDPPRMLSDLVARLLDPQPRRRPASARVVATRLVALRVAAPHVGATARRPDAPARQRRGDGGQGSARPAVVPDRAASEAPARTPGPVPTGSPGSSGPAPSPPGPGDRRPAARVPRGLALAVTAAVVVAGATFVALTAGGSGAPRRSAPDPAAPRGSAVPATHAIGPSSTTSAARAPAIPLPIVAATAPVDPFAAAQLRRLALGPADVAARARALAVPASSNFDAVLRALYAECDYFTPVGQQPDAHQFAGFVDGDVEVFDDLTTYPAGVPGQIISGVAVAIDKCPTIRVASGGSARPAEFAVHRIPAPAGVPTDAVAMTYTRTDEPDLEVRAVFLGTGRTLRVVLALAPSLAQSESDWARAAAHAWTRLADAR